MIEINDYVGKVLTISDCHGKLDKYKAILENKERGVLSIQLGDLGFKGIHDYVDNLNNNLDKVLFGNHDYYPYLNKKYSLKDSTYFKEMSLMCVRGAYSIDKYLRNTGIDHFDNEEISYVDFHYIIDLYEIEKPNIMITHDCPQSLVGDLFGINERTQTRTALQYMLDVHKPKLWVFGHHHRSIDITIDGCRFICLKKLETFEIDYTHYL